MSATDELRRMLDGRGVEWSDASDKDVLHTTWNNLNCWFNEFPDGWTAWGMSMRGTPEQAIVATLGGGECEMRADGSHCMNGVEFYECRSCGEYACVPTETGKSEPPNFCPNCGRRVKR